MGYCPPNYGEADVGVFVDYDIAHPAHLKPRDLEIAFLNLRRDVPSGLSDNPDIANHRIHSLIVVAERFESHAFGIALDFGNGLQNILNTQLPVSTSQQ